MSADAVSPSLAAQRRLMLDADTEQTIVAMAAMFADERHAAEHLREIAGSDSPAERLRAVFDLVTRAPLLEAVARELKLRAGSDRSGPREEGRAS